MWAWCATLAGAALATRFIPFREGGHWHLPETLAVAAIALVALLFSLYVVYVLEIVKLNNPRRFRRREEPADERRVGLAERRTKSPLFPEMRRLSAVTSSAMLAAQMERPPTPSSTSPARAPT